MGLYMAGGTALALQLGHRPSVDFDWFAPSIGNPEQLFQRLTPSGLPYTILSISHETLYLTINEVQMSFIGYCYPMLRPPVLWPDYNIHLADIVDIACMKLSAITNRGSRKNFIDLFFITRDHIPLNKCLTLFTQKYQQRDIGHVLRSLVYFADADSEPEVKIQSEVNWPKIKKTFESEIKKLTAKNYSDEFYT
ncbi:MAG: hypothetical protein A2511_02025 [Deltaproteobacteria bacterium RIFOXYD12_FULL_50_9]|nr:MAG: hypothetical protein A2511_02025 [Deltaproteobacteria bacterium RIFOXYD12_FULL_50_9]